MKLKVLIACEESQAVCKEFRSLGHEAYSCDILECSGGHPEWHIKGDAIKALYMDKWDLVIAHPPCDFLANSGVQWLFHPDDKHLPPFKRRRHPNHPDRLDDMIKAARFFNKFIVYGKTGNSIGIENPIMHKYAKEEIVGYVKYDQIIQPYQFGHKEKKATCLWLFNLPCLKETNNVYEDMMKIPYKDRCKVHYASPGPERAKLRSKTFQGIAEAMAQQWSKYIL